MVIRGVSGIFLGVSLFQAFRSWGQRRTPETGHLEVRTIFPTLLPSPLTTTFSFGAFYWWKVTTYRYFWQPQFAVCPLCIYISCSLLPPAPFSLPFSKMCPPLVLSLETVGGAYLQTLVKQNKTNNSSNLSLLSKLMNKCRAIVLRRDKISYFVVFWSSYWYKK